MTRAMRILNTAGKSAAVAAAVAPPPEAVTLESDFVVILAALLCALICVVGLIAVARCAWLRRVTGDGGYPTRQALANKGVKKKVVQSLPKFAYADSSPREWLATTECAICLAEFDAGDEIRVLPQCGHGFHVGCIDTWLGSHSSCPSCRQVLAVAARCQRCGRLPAANNSGGGGATSVAVNEPELKSGEDENAPAVNSNNNASGSSGTEHHSHNVNSGFLP
ncbi:RING-H2 finger protein ATL8-like [Lotus japonicus]|uniref:RING-H2 finger protein ATL8-like n=1 Tax=Lotus japonicus TaxID=34305 RepID=UPI002589DFE8|nr:RING-H2 finger protein ATL8-like [Lotus japonicus]